MSSARSFLSFKLSGTSPLMMRCAKPSMIAVAMESRKGSFRKDVYPGYKAHREVPPDLPRQMVRCREICEAFGRPTPIVAKIETPGGHVPLSLLATVEEGVAQYVEWLNRNV